MHVSWKLRPSLPPLNPCAFCINPTPTLGSSSTSRAGAGCDSAVCTNAAGTRVHTRACRHLCVCMCANAHPMPAHELTHANLPFTDTHVQARTVHIRCTHTCAPTAHTHGMCVHILAPPPREHTGHSAHVTPRGGTKSIGHHRAPCSALLLLLLSSCCWRCSAPAPKQVRDTGTLHCLVAARHAAAWHHVAPHGTNTQHHMAPHGTTRHLTEPRGTTWHHMASHGTIC